MKIVSLMIMIILISDVVGDSSEDDKNDNKISLSYTHSHSLSVLTPLFVRTSFIFFRAMENIRFLI